MKCLSIMDKWSSATSAKIVWSTAIPSIVVILLSVFLQFLLFLEAHCIFPLKEIIIIIIWVLCITPLLLLLLLLPKGFRFSGLLLSGWFHWKAAPIWGRFLLLVLNFLFFVTSRETSSSIIFLTFLNLSKGHVRASSFIFLLLLHHGLAAVK